MFKLLQAALMAALLVMVGLAVPASATVSTTTDLAVKVTVVDVNTLSTTETHPGDRVKFRVQVTNRGPDMAANLTITADPQFAPIAACLDASFLFTGGHGTCVGVDVPAGTKAKAMTNFPMNAPANGTISATFCVSIVNSPGQTDPNPANDCQTGAILVVP